MKDERIYTQITYADVGAEKHFEVQACISYTPKPNRYLSTTVTTLMLDSHNIVLQTTLYWS